MSKSSSKPKTKKTSEVSEQVETVQQTEVRDTKRSKSVKAETSVKKEVTLTPPVKEVKVSNVEEKPKSSKSKSSKVVVPEQKVETHVSQEESLSDVEDVVDSVNEDVLRKRREVTKDSVVSGIDELLKMVDEEINKMRETSAKSKGVKFLRTLRKKVVVLRSDTCKVIKQKNQTKRKSNGNSGFLKPVKISSELAKFTGWNPEDMKSRVDVTKYICKYISEHNLQNPENKREINADVALCNILDYDPSRNDKLTYPKIQGYLKKHFNPV